MTLLLVNLAGIAELNKSAGLDKLGGAGRLIQFEPEENHVQSVKSRRAVEETTRGSAKDSRATGSSIGCLGQH